VAGSKNLIHKPSSISHFECFLLSFDMFQFSYKIPTCTWQPMTVLILLFVFRGLIKNIFPINFCSFCDSAGAKTGWIAPNLMWFHEEMNPDRHKVDILGNLLSHWLWNYSKMLSLAQDMDILTFTDFSNKISFERVTHFETHQIFKLS
jgi:hypothetical protein